MCSSLAKSPWHPSWPTNQGTSQCPARCQRRGCSQESGMAAWLQGFPAQPLPVTHTPRARARGHAHAHPHTSTTLATGAPRG